MLTALGVIIGIIWIIVEECKEKPSNMYLGFKEFTESPEYEQIQKKLDKQNRKMKAAKARKKRLKRQKRQTTTLIIAHYCIKGINDFTFGNKRKRY